MIESSIVIPVYNKWDLTRQCLKSIAANTDKSRIEVIVVDNGSSDATEKSCLFLGKQLFGDFFHYIRNELNRNFAGVSPLITALLHSAFSANSTMPPAPI